MNSNTPVIVFGDSSSAVFLLAQLVKRGESILWIASANPRLLPVMPFVKSEMALAALAQGMDEGSSKTPQSGTFHRVFRNKGFKMPSWKRSANLDTQKEAMEDLVGAPEQACVGVKEFRLAESSPLHLERSLREQFETHPLITRIENTPVLEFEVYEHGGKIQFANHPTTEFKQFFFCDVLDELKCIPKLATVFKHQLNRVRMSSSVSALQVIFHHNAPIQASTDIGYVIPMNRDSGETFDRDVMGYFVSETESVWTVFMQASECEENHEIMKKLRRLKQSLNKGFESAEFLPEGKKDFLATISKELVKFQSSCLYTEGELTVSSKNPDFVMLSECFGFSSAMDLIAAHFDLQAIVPSEETSASTLDDVLASVPELRAETQAPSEYL